MGGLHGANGCHKNGQMQIQETQRPPEGGWGWMVAFGMALMFISTSGHYLSFVPLFSGILEQLGEQTTGATVIMTALTASVNFTGLVTNHLLRTVSYRVVAVLGGLLFALGMLLTTFAHSMVHIVVTYSIIAGVGMGLVAPSSYLAINSYFVSRRGLAMGFCQAGIGLGFITVPYLVEAMLHSYGFRGTMLLLGGISLNSVVGGLLYQPVEWHSIRLRLHKTINKEDESDLEEVPLGSRPTSGIGPSTLSMDVIPAEEDDLTLGSSHGNNLTNSSVNGTEKLWMNPTQWVQNSQSQSLDLNWTGPPQISTKLASEDTDCEEHVIISRRGSVIISSMLDGRAHQLLLPVEEEAGTERRDVMLFQKEPQDGNDNRAALKRPSISLANYGSNVLMFDNTIVDTSPRKAIGDHILQALHKVSNKFTHSNHEHTWSLLRQVPDEADEGDYSTFSNPSTSSEPTHPVIRRRKFSCCLRLATQLNESLDLALLKDPIYVNIVLGLSVSFASDTIFFTVFPFHLAQLPWPGFSDKEVALCLSITAGADAVARLVLPVIADRLNVGPRTAYLLGCLSSAVVRSIFASVQGSVTIFVMSGLVGFLKGALVVNQSLTIAEHCPLDRFAAAYSLFMVINGVITLCLGPLVGVIRDETQSFPFSIHILSGILFLCVLMWVLEHLWLSCRKQTLRSVAHTLKKRVC